MKTEKELFELMLKHQNLFKRGLCVWVINLWHENVINDDEKWLLDDYLDNNKPEECLRGSFWWEIGEIQPRLDWINEQIKKL